MPTLRTWITNRGFIKRTLVSGYIKNIGGGLIKKVGSDRPQFFGGTDILGFSLRPEIWAENSNSIKCSFRYPEVIAFGRMKIYGSCIRY